jgi:hypothetical protein
MNSVNRHKKIMATISGVSILTFPKGYHQRQGKSKRKLPGK